jgi:hypothetical protein
MISNVLIPLLRERFPNRGIKSVAGAKPCITIPAVHSEFGDFQIFDDGDEITLVAGVFTHGHFSNYDSIPVEEKEKIIAEDVADFLEKVFADQVVFWGSHKDVGGWRVVKPDSTDKQKHQQEYVWSGPRQSR